MMVGRLASLAFTRPPDLPPGEIARDEIRQVVEDTLLLASGEMVLDEWLAA